MDKGEIRAQDFTAQVRREIYIMRCLKHRHIVRMNEVLTSDTKLYIVMELVTGGELFERIEKGRISEDIARQYFQQLVDGVDFCHKKGVAHRDLKPENLLLDENGDIKITDFGFSSMKGMDVSTGLLYTQCGTPDYCAPEIIDSRVHGYTGAKVDAWSCGIILYALLCGRLPFQEPDTDKLYDLILACRVTYPDFLSPPARELLENLLVRDPNVRFDLPRVKRHAWFLINYEGDDSRFLRKKPFFNKNQKDLTGSSPSSPTAPPPKEPNSGSLSNGAPPTSLPTPYLTPSPAERRASAVPQPVSQPSSQPIPQPISQPILQPKSQAQEPSPREANGMPPNESLLQHASAQQKLPQSRSQPQVQPVPPQPQPIMDAGTPRNIHSGSAAARIREDPYTTFRPASPATDIAMRAPTPPSHDVFTKVEDRPATPARRQTSASTAAAFKAAVAAASMHANDNVGNTQPPAPVQPSYTPSLSASRLSPPTSSQPPPVSNGVPSSLDSTGFPSAGDIMNRHDDSSSEPDSVEDYENKPAPLLEMPANPRQILKLGKDGRRQVHSLPPSTRQPRQRSDLTGSSANNIGMIPQVGSGDAGSTSTSAIHRPRRTFARDGTNSGSVGDMRALRTTTRSDVPSSPPVVYSPSPVNNSQYERYRSVSPGFGAMRAAGMPDDGVANGGIGHSGGGAQHPWQSSSALSRDENGAASAWYTDAFAGRLWNIVNKLRGTCDPVNAKLSRELRKDMSGFVNELNQLTRMEDVLKVFANFLSLIDTQGLSETPGQSLDGDFETGGVDGRDDGNGEMRGMLRHVGGGVTDLSSEEEPLSISPVLADTGGPQLSDLARRRNLSDLLTKWIKRADHGAEDGPDGEGSGQLVDLVELQKVMREHQGGREESNLADDLLRLMNASDDGSAVGFGNVVSGPGQSPPPPHVQPTRSADSYTQTRYISNMSNGGSTSGVGRGVSTNPVRSVSNNNTPLPLEYVPGRFKEPNSMPSRGRNGNDRQMGLSTRTDARPTSADDFSDLESDVIPRERDSTSHMANSMGMHDVPYYISDKKGGMATKLRGVLQTMKAKNHRLGEHHAQFRSSLPPDEIMRLLGRVLQDMGGNVTIKKETKRKMKCKLVLKPNSLLFAGIELVATDGGMTCVAFRRSRADKGKTDTGSFHSFFEQVRARFLQEANAIYPAMANENGASSRRRNEGGSSRHIGDNSGDQAPISGS